MAFPFFVSPHYPEPRRVVITGAGILTSMGRGWRENADGFREGRLAFGPVSLFDTSRQRVHEAGQLDLPERLPENALTARQEGRLDRATRMLIHAGAEAWSQAGWDGLVRADPIPLCLGTSAGAMELGETYYRHARENPDSRRGQAARVINYQTHRQAIHLANALDFFGPVTIIANACASGANAIGHAVSQVRRGECERAFAGGYDALAQLVFAGFDSLQALTPSVPPRPFDAHRDGLALGEGAAMLAIESLESARARGAEILAEIVGYGVATDSHHLTQPHPEGDAALRSMNEACRQAGLRAADIDYLNSHGTGTPLNDVAEGRAIQRWAGADVDKIRVSSTKASIGHLLGGAGAVETVISLMALRENFLPPTTTVETPDEVCTFDLVREPREAEVRRVLTNSFGFGGANATLVLAEFEEAGATVSIPFATREHESAGGGVRVTGWGAVSPAGWGAKSLLDALDQPEQLGVPETFTREGREARPLPVRRVPKPVEKLLFLRDPRLRRASPVARFSVAAALEAIGGARLEKVRAGELRLGVVYSYVNGCVNYSSRFYGEVLQDPSLASPILFPETVYNAPASHLSALLGAHAANYTIVGDSAQFLNGLEIAARWLQEDRCDGVVVVGGEEFDWLCAEAYQLFGADTVYSEGAGALFLEREGEASSAEISLEALVGPALYTNAHPRSAMAREVAVESASQEGWVADATLLTRASRSDTDESVAWADFPGRQREVAAILGEGMGAAVAWECVTAAALATMDGQPVIVSAIGENEQAGAACFGGSPSIPES